LLLDAGDAIEEGAAGQSTELLSALAWRGAEQCLSAFHVDPVLVELARNAGVGATIAAVFNSAPGAAVTAGRLEAEAVVGAVADALPPGEPPFDRSGPACALQIGGVTVAVVSRRYLVRDPAAFGALGIDVAVLQAVVLKARLASLDPAVRLALPAAVHDVDAPGATSPSGAAGLDLGRKVYPLSKEAIWPPG
jgi:microcystin degradation protein MlrC